MIIASAIFLAKKKQHTAHNEPHKIYPFKLRRVEKVVDGNGLVLSKKSCGSIGGGSANRAASTRQNCDTSRQLVIRSFVSFNDNCAAAIAQLALCARVGRG